MECGVLGCGKYTIIGLGIGAAVGVTVYFLLPKGDGGRARISRPPRPAELPPADEGDLVPAMTGLRRSLRRRCRSCW